MASAEGDSGVLNVVENKVDNQGDIKPTDPTHAGLTAMDQAAKMQGQCSDESVTRETVTSEKQDEIVKSQGDESQETKSENENENQQGIVETGKGVVDGERIGVPSQSKDDNMKESEDITRTEMNVEDKVAPLGPSSASAQVQNLTHNPQDVVVESKNNQEKMDMSETPKGEVTMVDKDDQDGSVLQNTQGNNQDQISERASQGEGQIEQCEHVVEEAMETETSDDSNARSKPEMSQDLDSSSSRKTQDIGGIDAGQRDAIADDKTEAEQAVCPESKDKDVSKPSDSEDIKLSQEDNTICDNSNSSKLNEGATETLDSELNKDKNIEMVSKDKESTSDLEKTEMMEGPINEEQTDSQDRKEETEKEKEGTAEERKEDTEERKEDTEVNGDDEQPSAKRKRVEDGGEVAEETVADVEASKSAADEAAKKAQAESWDLLTFPAQNVFEYQWPQDGGGEWYFVQEQISEYLSCTSFKRKYPDIERRTMLGLEKDFLRERGVVSEEQVTLGLTALKSEELYDLMMKDYPEKYAAYVKVMQEKERQSIKDRNKAYSKQSVVDPNKMKDFLKKAAKQASEYNSMFMRERREERQYYFDMQTLTMQIPANKMRKLDPAYTKPGPYPVAVIPGQFQNYHRQYDSDELKYFPISTALYGPSSPRRQDHYVKTGDQDAASDDGSIPVSLSGDESTGLDSGSSSGSDSSGDEGAGDEADGELPLPLQPPADGRVVPMDEKPKQTAYVPKNLPDAICGLCLKDRTSNKDGKPEELVHCSQCDNSGHPSCLEMTDPTLVKVICSYPWQCMECKTCMHCGDPTHEDKMMFCDDCDRGYHTFCVGLKDIPTGKWACESCKTTSSTTVTLTTAQLPMEQATLEPIQNSTDLDSAATESASMTESAAESGTDTMVTPTKPLKRPRGRPPGSKNKEKKDKGTPKEKKSPKGKSGDTPPTSAKKAKHKTKTSKNGDKLPEIPGVAAMDSQDTESAADLPEQSATVPDQAASVTEPDQKATAVEPDLATAVVDPDETVSDDSAEESIQETPKKSRGRPKKNKDTPTAKDKNTPAAVKKDRDTPKTGKNQKETPVSSAKRQRNAPEAKDTPPTKKDHLVKEQSTDSPNDKAEESISDDEDMLEENATPIAPVKKRRGRPPTKNKETPTTAKQVKDIAETPNSPLPELTGDTPSQSNNEQEAEHKAIDTPMLTAKRGRGRPKRIKSTPLSAATASQAITENPDPSPLLMNALVGEADAANNESEESEMEHQGVPVEQDTPAATGKKCGRRKNEKVIPPSADLENNESDSEMEQQAVPMEQDIPLATGKRRGRPKKDKNIIPSADLENNESDSEMEQQAVPMEQDTPTATVKRRGRPKKVKNIPPSADLENNESDSEMEQLAVPMEQDTPTATGKRRGRPKKDKNILPSADLATDKSDSEMEQAGEMDTPSVSGKKRGRPKKEKAQDKIENSIINESTKALDDDCTATSTDDDSESETELEPGEIRRPKRDAPRVSSSTTAGKKGHPDSISTGGKKGKAKKNTGPPPTTSAKAKKRKAKDPPTPSETDKETDKEQVVDESPDKEENPLESKSAEEQVTPGTKRARGRPKVKKDVEPSPQPSSSAQKGRKTKKKLDTEEESKAKDMPATPASTDETKPGTPGTKRTRGRPPKKDKETPTQGAKRAKREDQKPAEEVSPADVISDPVQPVLLAEVLQDIPAESPATTNQEDSESAIASSESVSSEQTPDITPSPMPDSPVALTESSESNDQAKITASSDEARTQSGLVDVRKDYETSIVSDKVESTLAADDMDDIPAQDMGHKPVDDVGYKPADDIGQADDKATGPSDEFDHKPHTVDNTKPKEVLAAELPQETCNDSELADDMAVTETPVAAKQVVLSVPPIAQTEQIKDGSVSETPIPIPMVTDDAGGTDIPQTTT